MKKLLLLAAVLGVMASFSSTVNHYAYDQPGPLFMAYDQPGPLVVAKDYV